MNKTDNTMEISIPEIFRIILANLLIILLAGAIFGAAAWFYTSKYAPKMYRTEVNFYAVSNKQKDNDSAVTTNELASSRQLASTYSYILTSNRVMKQASEQLRQKGIEYSFTKLKSMVNVTTTNTEVFTATVSTTDRKNIKVIADTIADSAVAVIADIVGNGEAKILDYAEEPTQPYSPKVMTTTVAVALAAMLLVSVIVVLRALTDTTIWSEEDLTKRYNIPVLGSVPQLAALDKTGNGKE